MEPYNYVITWYPTDEQKTNGSIPRVISHGFVIASSQLDAFTKMVAMVDAADALEAEQIEFCGKPFISSLDCPTKKSIGNSYNFYLDNTIYEVKTSTAEPSFFMDGFINTPYEVAMKLPKKMLMIDVLSLINDDKTL